jgi:hypothetical protein
MSLPPSTLDTDGSADSLAEAAWRVLEPEGGSPGRAEAAFVLARVLGELGEDRERARGLAQQAEQGFADAGPRRREDLDAVRTWLRAAGSRAPAR